MSLHAIGDDSVLRHLTCWTILGRVRTWTRGQRKVQSGFFLQRGVGGLFEVGGFIGKEEGTTGAKGSGVTAGYGWAVNLQSDMLKGAMKCIMMSQ